MVAKEYCCYTRPYSNIEGYQRAYTLCYYASLEEEGVVLAVQRQQGGECTTEQVICPTGDFGRLMPLMRYLCENGVGCYLILMMWEYKIFSTGMNINAISKIFFAHNRTFNMPSRSSVTPW